MQRVIKCNRLFALPKDSVEVLDALSAISIKWKLPLVGGAAIQYYSRGKRHRSTDDLDFMLTGKLPSGLIKSFKENGFKLEGGPFQDSDGDIGNPMMRFSPVTKISGNEDFVIDLILTYNTYFDKSPMRRVQFLDGFQFYILDVVDLLILKYFATYGSIFEHDINRHSSDMELLVKYSTIRSSNVVSTLSSMDKELDGVMRIEYNRLKLCGMKEDILSMVQDKKVTLNEACYK